MAIEYVWNVQQMESYPTYETHRDVVFNVHYKVVASDSGYEAEAECSQVLRYDDQTAFVPYDQLEESMVISWVQSALGTEAQSRLENDLAAIINLKKNPPAVTLPLPWASPTP